jgi:glutaredoxin 3
MERGTLAPVRCVGPIRRVLRLTLLAPDIVEAILSGRQPAGLQLDGLMKRFPVGWEAQRLQLLTVQKVKIVVQRIEIYTARQCPYCASAKAILKRKGLAFTEFDIAGNWELRDEMIERANGNATVPQIFIGSTHIGGCAELQELDRSNRLDALLSA